MSVLSKAAQVKLFVVCVCGMLNGGGVVPLLTEQCRSSVTDTVGVGVSNSNCTSAKWMIFKFKLSCTSSGAVQRAQLSS